MYLKKAKSRKGKDRIGAILYPAHLKYPDLKGWSKKMRPHETLTNANFKVLYRNKLYF